MAGVVGKAAHEGEGTILLVEEHFDTERGKLCPMAAHVAFPYIDILRYGGQIPGQPEGTATFCCPDVDTINVFRITREG